MHVQLGLGSLDSSPSSNAMMWWIVDLLSYRMVKVLYRIQDVHKIIFAVKVIQSSTIFGSIKVCVPGPMHNPKGPGATMNFWPTVARISTRVCFTMHLEGNVYGYSPPWSHMEWKEIVLHLNVYICSILMKYRAKILPEEVNWKTAVE